MHLTKSLVSVLYCVRPPLLPRAVAACDAGAVIREWYRDHDRDPISSTQLHCHCPRARAQHCPDRTQHHGGSRDSSLSLPSGTVVVVVSRLTLDHRLPQTHAAAGVLCSGHRSRTGRDPWWTREDRSRMGQSAAINSFSDVCFAILLRMLDTSGVKMMFTTRLCSPVCVWTACFP